MDQRPTNRREFLLAGSTAAIALLAGCSSGDDDDDGSFAGSSSDAADGDDATDGGDGTDGDGSGGTAAQWDDDVPDDPAFLANPDVTGPSDEASYVFSTTVRDHGDIHDFERFEVEVESVTLHDISGDEVTVPIEATVDLTAYEIGPAGDDITLGWDLGIPAGTYDSMDVTASGVDVVHVDDGDVTADFEDPPLAEFSRDEGHEVEAGDALQTDYTAVLTYDGGPSFEESLAVGTMTGAVLVLNPENYEND